MHCQYPSLLRCTCAHMFHFEACLLKVLCKERKTAAGCCLCCCLLTKSAACVQPLRSTQHIQQPQLICHGHQCLRTNRIGAVQAKALDQKALATINAYNPGLSAAWMFQRAMSVRPNHSSNPNFINRLLGVNFRSMHLRGDWVLKPFMQVNQACLS